MITAILNTSTHKYLSWGYVASGGLGPTPAGYEEVQLASPPDDSLLESSKTALQQMEDLITQGQATMSGHPLPDDLQKQIFDLEVFIQNYYKRQAFQLIREAITAFVIDPARTDVTQDQRNLVDYMKQQMLGMFP